MNIDDLSIERRRGYDNRLRQQQARQTRQRILDAAVEAIAAPDARGVTLAAVARGAGVSEPTLYRHFGSRERLYEELDLHAQAKLGLPDFPDTLDEMPLRVRELFETFGANAELVRAAARTRLGREMRARGRARRTKRLRALLAEKAPQLDAATLDRVASVLRVLVSHETYETLTGEMGLSSRDAGDAVAWALATLVAGLEEPEKG